MNVTLRELAFMTGVLCFGALIGAWILHRHVTWLVRRVMREYVPSKPVYVPDRREEYTEADREELSRKVSFRDADTVAVFAGMNEEAEPETELITDARPSAPWVNDRGTVIHPRRTEARRRDERGRFAPREPDAVIAPGSPPPFRPDLPDRGQAAASADWDAIASLGATPEQAAAALAMKHFGRDYSQPALAGSRA